MAPSARNGAAATTARALDAWTADQEAALLRAIMAFKPAGMHKHFRMLAIRNAMLNAGVIAADDAHLSIAGIWHKLGTLYDLEKLDEREDAVINDGRDDDDDEGEGEGEGEGGDDDDDDDDDDKDDQDGEDDGHDGNHSTDEDAHDATTGQDAGRQRRHQQRHQQQTTAVPYWREFELPRDEFEELMWARRLAPDRTSSSPALSRRGSTVADTDEPRSSPASGMPPPPPAPAPTARGSARKSGRLSKLQNELLDTDRGTRGRTAKAGSGSAVDEEDQEMGGDAAAAAADDEAASEEENGDEEEKKAAPPSARRETRTTTPRAAAAAARTRRTRRK